MNKNIIVLLGLCIILLVAPGHGAEPPDVCIYYYESTGAEMGIYVPAVLWLSQSRTNLDEGTLPSLVDAVKIFKSKWSRENNIDNQYYKLESISLKAANSIIESGRSERVYYLFALVDTRNLRDKSEPLLKYVAVLPSGDYFEATPKADVRK
jgi:hypothetical protein